MLKPKTVRTQIVLPPKSTRPAPVRAHVVTETPKRPRTGRPTSLGDLLDRALDRFDQRRREA